MSDQSTFKGTALLRGMRMNGEAIEWPITLREPASEVMVSYGPPGSFVFSGQREDGMGVFLWWPAGGQDPRP